MVFKKPYAFIIKHFRIIHLLLLIPMFYLLAKSGNIVQFFQDYINNEYHLVSGVAVSSLSATYINFFMYLAIVVIIAVYVTISFLLQNKDKPTKYYNVSIIYYVFLFMMLTVCVSIFQMLEEDTLSNTLVHIIRDIVIVIRYSEYIFIGFNLVRGVGFNLRKFNFESDVADLEISAEDSEEFEFLVGRDTYKTKRSIRRFIRELGYYYQENKFIFTVIFVVIGIVLANILYTNINVKQKIYHENDSVAFGEINFVINNAYLTSLDLNGKKINNDKIYLVLQTTLSNRYRDDKTFNYDNLRVIVGKKRIAPNLMIGNDFLDLGNPYNGSLIKGLTNLPFLVIYELDKADRQKKFTVEAYSSYSAGGGGAIVKKVSIKPETINDNVATTNVNMGSTVNFSKTHIGNSTVNIKGYNFYNRFEFVHNGMVKDVAIDIVKDRNKTLMVLDYVLNLDNKSDYTVSPKDERTFFENFVQIRYEVDGEKYTRDISIENPVGYKDKIIFKIDNNILEAEKIEALVTVRNVSYVIKLK